ncbi:Tfp pilus assembly protein PilW [Aeromonas rivipollensis]|uniref:PilW family protein n=1 Tax=Aeromonas rivipollensis TaxID=948519 RepID=UPI00399C73D1
MNARGFTLIEWLIAMLIGVFLVGGGLSIFVASRATTEDCQRRPKTDPLWLISPIEK